MAEAEDLLSDAARHATVYAQRLWRRYRPPPPAAPTALLADIAPRLDLLVTAVAGRSLPIRIAQLPARPTLLSRIYRRNQSPWLKQPIPATSGERLWLPADSGMENITQGNAFFRAMALQQAARASRGSAEWLDPAWPALLADAYLLLEAWAADIQLAEQLPGMASAVTRLRQHALQMRPPLHAFSPVRRPLESLLRQLLATPCGQLCTVMPHSSSPQDSVLLAPKVLASIGLPPDDKNGGNAPLLKDWWTGELRRPALGERNTIADSGILTEPQTTSEPTRSSRLLRRPEVREAEDGEDDNKDPGIFMVQADEPHQQAEDPLGLNRPVDKDEDISADEYGDMLSELSHARLVSTPGRSREVLISDDPPDTNTAMQLKTAIREQNGLRYPEWDYRISAYHQPGTTLHVLPNLPGSQQWVDETLAEHRSLLNQIRRRFEMLSAQRVTRRKQLDGDDIDLQAYIDSYADFRAGSSLSEALYQTRRTAERNLAITLLIDISGSTDSWIASNRRIIDVEREALLLVSVALEGMGEPWSIQAFSGEGPDAVIVRQIKSFDENYSNDVALRISSLEPEHYTRAGTAIRHASTGLLKQPASHRLLLVLSDGKPNDNDIYEGQYGVEDMRQAITEATLQGISAFCLTIDRQAPAYLPRIFGAHNYALLPKPELLPMVLLDWMKRLVMH
ncbi:nitric oxide reductase activation protein NorD [Alcanivorax quisquiliarum]|uniref:Nitric oxide reductase NorD protein n=1 Tax=Alcanivorax quisquiliarum TaxID=2933565 RepID=A0ABT0E8C3_9GAMM|nr:hypothetical protein [Alcanivorax quisquiliarum]MCK0538093.1 hypothetical protein [Alcanivorax quisquiliarum]